MSNDRNYHSISMDTLWKRTSGEIGVEMNGATPHPHCLCEVLGATSKCKPEQKQKMKMHDIYAAQLTN